MSKGLSWRQRGMLESLAKQTNREQDHPVAWRRIDYGPTDHDLDPDFDSSVRLRWNIEQATRRALRSLERRGLVELVRYCFELCPEDAGVFGTSYVWSYVHPDCHIPGEGRIMTGATLTDADGRWLRKRKRSAWRAATGSPEIPVRYLEAPSSGARLR